MPGTSASLGRSWSTTSSIGAGRSSRGFRRRMIRPVFVPTLAPLGPTADMNDSTLRIVADDLGHAFWCRDHAVETTCPGRPRS